MRRAKYAGIALASLLALLCLPQVGLPDASPGDVIDHTNWERAEGLIPESTLNWVKKGDWVMKIEDLNFDLSEYYAEFALQALEKNKGRYDVDADNGIIDAKTLQAPDHILGLPFPDIDPNDPKAAVKIMHNNHYMQYIVGDVRANFNLLWVGRSGFEREVGCLWSQAAMDGWPGARIRQNPHRIEKYATLVVVSPFDVAGTAVMLWRYLEPNKLDSCFGYVPAIRRVRRMSPANRSDAYIGSDACVDDANGYDGKVTAFEWRLLGHQEGIVPWYDTNPIPVVQNEKNEWKTSKNVKKIVYGYEEQDWQGAPWAPTNMAWARRPVYVLEMKPKDPYYNYGTHYMWIDAKTFTCNYKIIHDRSGEYWKTYIKGDVPCQSADNRMKFLSLGAQQVVDDRTDHCTIIECISPRNSYVFFAKVDVHDFSLGGFQRFCR